MKKIIYFVTIVAMFLGTRIYLEAEEQDSRYILSEDIKKIVANQISSDERAMLADINNYSTQERYEAMNSSDLVMKVYNEIYWDCLDCGYAELIDKGENRKTIDYIVFSEEIIRGRKAIINDKIAIGNVSKYDEIPLFLKDILQMDKTIEIDGKTCNVQELYCFDGKITRDGVAVYIVTDQGAYVKYYDIYEPSPMTFTEGEFISLGMDFYRYITSPAYLYDEEGNALIKTGISFKDYVDNKEKYDAELEQNNEAKNGKWEWFILGAVLLVVTVLIVVLLKNNKRK